MAHERLAQGEPLGSPLHAPRSHNIYGKHDGVKQRLEVNLSSTIDSYCHVNASWMLISTLDAPSDLVQTAMPVSFGTLV